jgi:hypothetical protein
VPSLAQLFWFFPQQGQGMLGVKLGALTCLVILAENAIWGAVLGFVAGGRGPSSDG